MTDLPAREQRFYTEQFRGRTLVIASPSTAGTDRDAVKGCIDDLVHAGVRVVQVVGGGRVAHWQPDDAGIISVWRQLRRHGRMQISVPDGGTDRPPALTLGVGLSTRLRAFKLVLLSPSAPRLRDGSRPDSFATLDPAAMPTEELPALAAQALRGGVATVNVCHPADVAAELLTYAGAGVCYTLGDYCRVERLGIDDYGSVAELIERGVEEGYLKPRDPDSLAQLIVNGYGARVGDHHLAGFSALLTEPYATAHLGEVCALTTISRFAGEGIGGRLVDAMLCDAVAEGLDGVFACTTAEPAARFFRRLGFVEVPQAELPAAKWEGYEPSRRAEVRVFMNLLGMVAAPRVVTGQTE